MSALRNCPAGKKFQSHPSAIAQEIYQALVTDLIPRESPVIETAPLDVSSYVRKSIPINFLYLRFLRAVTQISLPSKCGLIF